MSKETKETKETKEKSKKNLIECEVIARFEVGGVKGKDNTVYNPGDIYKTDSPKVVEYLRNIKKCIK